MNDIINWLITILHDDQLTKVAVRFRRDALPFDCIEYFMEPESRRIIKRELLPPHIQSCGPIVAIEEIFETIII